MRGKAVGLLVNQSKIQALYALFPACEGRSVDGEDLQVSVNGVRRLVTDMAPRRGLEPLT